MLLKILLSHQYDNGDAFHPCSDLPQFEFLHPRLVWGDGSTFDSDVVLLDGFHRVDRDLVIGLGRWGNDVSSQA